MNLFAANTAVVVQLIGVISFYHHNLKGRLLHVTNLISSLIKCGGKESDSN